jgi:hypothetical protein
LSVISPKGDMVKAMPVDSSLTSLTHTDLYLPPETSRVREQQNVFLKSPQGEAVRYSTITQSLALRPKTSGEYISSALAGGTTKVPGVVARATYE